jgi:hypothetical protein
MTIQQILDDGGGISLGGVGLDIREARTAEVAKNKM